MARVKRGKTGGGPNPTVENLGDELWVRVKGQSTPDSWFYPGKETRDAHRNAFRGEPAITEFDWPSPLPTAHPPGFQPWWVRASTRSYPRFTLAMGRSLRFGLEHATGRPIRTRFRYGFPTRVNLATHC